MIKLVLLRHGESSWNEENKFTGWTDVPLTEKGKKEALTAGETLKRENYVFDSAYTSVLKRAIKTLWIVLEEMDLVWIPVIRSWRLNERHYGALQGLNKRETAIKYGDEQMIQWRRSYDVQPPPLDKGDDRYPGNDPRYRDLSLSELPITECLKDTEARLLPYWNDCIVPEIKAGKKLIITAHGNSLRALIKHLDGIGEKDILGINIPTGIPLVYELDEKLIPMKSYYLGDPNVIDQKINAVASQGTV